MSTRTLGTSLFAAAALVCVALGQGPMLPTTGPAAPATTTTATSSPAAAGGKQWPLLANGHIRSNTLKVDDKGSLACVQCDVITPSTQPNTPPAHSGGLIVLDLAKGEITEASALLKDVMPKRGLVLSLSPSPAGDFLAAVTAGSDGPKVSLTCYLLDRKTFKPVKLTEVPGKLDILWAGKDLLVSPAKGEAFDIIEKYSAEGKKLDMPKVSGFLIGVSADGKRLAVAAQPDDLATPLAYKDAATKARLVIVDESGKAVKSLTKPGEFPVACRLSPTGKFAAVTLPANDVRGARGMRFKTTVHAVDSDKSWPAGETTLLLALSDAGVLTSMDEQPMGPFLGDIPGSDIKQWDAEGKSKTLVKDAMDACVAGDCLYYVTNEPTPVLKMIKMAAKTGD